MEQTKKQPVCLPIRCRQPFEQSRGQPSDPRASDAPAQLHVLSFPRYDVSRDDDDNGRVQDIASRFRDGNLATDVSEAVSPADTMLIIAGRFLLTFAPDPVARFDQSGNFPPPARNRTSRWPCSQRLDRWV